MKEEQCMRPIGPNDYDEKGEPWAYDEEDGPHYMIPGQPKGLYPTGPNG